MSRWSLSGRLDEDLSRSGYVEFILQRIWFMSSKFKIFLLFKSFSFFFFFNWALSVLCILIYGLSTGVHLSKMWFWVYWGTARTEKVCFIIIWVFSHCYLTSYLSYYLSYLHKKERKTVCVYCLVLTMAPCRPSPVDPRTSSHLRYFF